MMGTLDSGWIDRLSAATLVLIVLLSPWIFDVLAH
jgi:hypothetical protein